MKISVRLLSFLLCAALLLPCMFTISGCSPSDPGQEPSDDFIYFTDNGATAYRVIRPDVSSSDLSAASVELRKAITAATGAPIGIDTDWVDRGTAVPEDTPEILLGLTNRQESIDAHAALAESEYTISVVGNRLVIVGYDDACTIKAVEAFITDILGHAKDLGTYTASELVLTTDFTKKGNYIVKNYLNEFDKSSLSMYLDDKMTCREEEIFAFDDSSLLPASYRAEDREGIADCVGFRLNRNNTHWTVFSLPTDSFFMDIADKFAQTVRLWVYVNDVDLIACDHDAVYDTPQKGSGTLYITLSDKNGNVGHAWQHTFFGSGWHEMELSFTCHNVAYDNLEKIDYSNLTQMTVWCNAYEGLELRFDDMRLCTYDNPGYIEPEAPNGGRWLSTCDYEALDGPILTEWYGSYFDLEEATQGSSSVAIRGHKENVDHRVCIGVKDVPVSYEEDTICFDMYISDLNLLGTDWQIRLEHNAQAGHYSFGYDVLRQYVVNEQGKKSSLKNGWNHIRLPLSATTVRIDEAHRDVLSNDLTLTLLVFFIAGTGETDAQNYLIRYDNIYVTRTANLG